MRDQHSIVEADRLHETVEHRRVSCYASCREAQRRQSQVARARGGDSAVRAAMAPATDSVGV